MTLRYARSVGACLPSRQNHGSTSVNMIAYHDSNEENKFKQTSFMILYQVERETWRAYISGAGGWKAVWTIMTFKFRVRDTCAYFALQFQLLQSSYLLLLEKILRRVQTLCVALRAARNSPVHSNGVIKYAIVIRLFRTVLCDRLKNFSRYNIIIIIGRPWTEYWKQQLQISSKQVYPT